MSYRVKFAFGCHFLVGALMASFGLVYLFREQFMPYHEVAVGMPWVDIPPNMQVLTLALMKVFGGTSVVLALVLYLVLLVPFRQGARWAMSTAPLIGLAQSAVTFYGMNHVALNTTANPPFWAPSAAAILAVIGFVLTGSAPRKQPVREHHRLLSP